MVLIIAEIGINHQGNINLAHEMIRQAAMCGADVAKFQAYSVDALFGPNGADPNEDIYKSVKPLEFTKEQFEQINEWCKEEEVEFMVSVFDQKRLGWAEDIGVKRHKIASRVSKLDRDLAEKMIATGKECFMSLGFETKMLDDRPDNLKFLYCVSEYPTEYNRINLPMAFSEDLFYGFSDHSLGLGASLAAISRGAKVIEKHFTLNKALDGYDHVCSINPDELSDLVKYAKEISKAI